MAIKQRKQTKIEARITRQELREQLLARGITRPPSPEELAIVAKWKSRPKKEREQIIAKLGRLKIDPPLSEIIHQMRS